MSRFVVFDQTPGCRGADYAIHAQVFQCPEVGSIGDQVRGKLVVPAVTRDKRDLDPLNRPNCQRRRRVPVRRFDDDFPGIVKKLIEAGTPDDSDHESSLLEPLDFESLGFESLDLESLGLELLDLESLGFELLDLELLDFEMLDLELLDFESVT